MILELLRALLLAGLPVGVVSYFLFTWALRRRSPGSTTSLKAVQRELKAESKQRAQLRKGQKKEQKKAQQKEQPGRVANLLAEGAHFSRDAPLDLIHNKWLKFGGGFYGVVGLITYVVVELGELWNFALQFESIWALMANFGIDTLVNLLVGALRNFIIAIAWPGYWLSNIDSQFVWLWFAAAYGGYWAGARLALRRFAAVAQRADHPL